MRVTFILNARSGSCDAAEVSKAAKRVSREHRAVATIHVLDEDSDIAALVMAALAEGAQIVVGGGGDGTINAIAAALIGPQVPLGVLPLGTLNHFAKDLKIPLGLNDALNNVFVGAHRYVDVGEVNGRIFLNNSGLGLYPRIVQSREAIQKRGYPKWLALAAATIRKIRTYSLMRVSLIKDDGQKLTRSTPFLFVGNNKFEISGLRIGTREQLDGGRLWIYLAPEAGRLRLAVLAVAAIIGRLRMEDLVAFETSEVEVTTRRKHQKVSSDGEVFLLGNPLRYRCRANALRVIGPPDAAIDASGA